MKRKVIITSICIFVFSITIVVFLLIRSNIKGNDTDYITISNFSLVYRYGNYAYDRKDELYLIEKDGTIRYFDMKNKNKNTTLISTVNAILQDSDTIIGKYDSIPENIIEGISYSHLSKLKYDHELGEIDAPNTVYYILIETDTSVELIKIADYGANNISSDFKLREETKDYIDNVISSINRS
ncbi:hypothetical protein RASY3_13385 [Ruminococcus albus SY3]|uniref:Uncharacterized protein n=1 Tax=Ruminococcus albus SY3 TaxID=1341156 RepID=A0A011WN54_RUMAL|nr:hypothetical protein [Ruminococcus albus]EXM38440.1 hypothetical protein RASY3_13385 [Ruminococcus albus SY3]